MNTELLELQIDCNSLQFITNLQEIKEKVKLQLARYDIEVNLQNLQEAKKLATELNSFDKRLNDKRIEIQKKAMEPIDALKIEVDCIRDFLKEGREKIISQVKVFEDKKRNLCLNLLRDELENLYNEKNIEEEFKNIKIDDLAIISHLTDTDTLNKKAKNEVISRVNSALATQMMVKTRLSTLENACFKAGLKSLLGRQHIESFLKEPEEIYNAKLQSLIQTEVKRQAEIEARFLKQEEEKLKREAEIKAREEIQKQMQEEKKAENPVQKVEKQEIVSSPIVDVPVQMPKQPNILDELEEPRKQKFVVIASFEIECINETVEILKQKYLTKFSNDFKSFKNIEVKLI